jgi:hypothetical protein
MPRDVLEFDTRWEVYSQPAHCYFRVGLKILNSSPSPLWILRLSRACCGVWLRRWSPRLGRELAEARRVGARAEELSAIRDILYEDKWFRIATAVYVHLKKLFAEDGKAGELLEAAERRLYGLRLEVIEVPLLKIEAAVDQDGRVAAVRCRAALDVGVEAVFEGTAPGYKLEEAAGAEAALDKRRGEEEGWVGRVLEEVRREFSGLPVYVGVEDGYVYVKRTAPMDQRQIRRYLETCRRLSFRFDRGGRGGSSRWRSYSHLQRFKPASNPAQTPTGWTPLMDRLAEAVAAHLCRHRASACSDSHSTSRGASSPR